MYSVEPTRIACDRHPDYYSTRFAERQGMPIVHVQHHEAHLLACMAENGIDAPVLGVVWDGTGFGWDGTIWGGEFFHVIPGTIRRVAHLRPFLLPGGELAVREPRRCALGLLYAWLGDELFTHTTLPVLATFSAQEREVLAVALRRGINTPMTTSVGRLFDAVAALAGVCLCNRYEGQAAMEWEWCAADSADVHRPDCYSLPVSDEGVVDWAPLVAALLADLRAGARPAVMSARFHTALIETILVVCRQVGESRVVLSGGCFLNRRLLEGVVRRLTEEGFTPYWHQRVPPGDGGIALGQIVAAANQWVMSHVPGNPRQDH
jgi:hydrogenase maturation protein HypF